MKRFNFTPVQEATLLACWQETAAKLVHETTFNSPEDDQRSIRRVVYLQGKLDLLRELREDNFPEIST